MNRVFVLLDRYPWTPYAVVLAVLGGPAGLGYGIWMGLEEAFKNW
jgi:hypothetical protein